MAVPFVLALAFAAANNDTTVTIGLTRRDLTGDGRPEILRLVGVGRTIDSLALTLTIDSDGTVIYTAPFRALTLADSRAAARRERRSLSHAQYIAEFGTWTFMDSKFLTAGRFVQSWRSSAPFRLQEIPETIARDGGFPGDTARANAIWREIEASGITIFEFSPGGDAVVPIGWSPREKRFFRLIACC